MQSRCPEFHYALRTTGLKILQNCQKNHDFLNYGLTTIEQIYSDLSENESIVKQYEPKNQAENEKFNQRLFTCDGKSQMRVYTYKGDKTSFEALVRTKDNNSKIKVCAKTHDNLNLFVGTSNGGLEQYS